MIKVAIIGYGNIGQYVFESISNADDFELVGIVRRDTSNPPIELSNVKVVSDIMQLSQKPQVAILCVPSRNVREYALKYLELGINTVDSYDIHSEIWDLRQTLDKAAKQHNAVSIVSAGWDPGSDSVVRALLEATAPNGITYTNFGPGMSMGHTVAVKAIPGVKKAISMTIPTGTSIHRRMVYVEIEPHCSYEDISKLIKEDPYFSNDETHVIKVDNIEKYIDMGHGVNLTRKGVSGKTHNQLFEFNMKINNPALTAEILIAVARATMNQKPGAYTMIEIPVIDLINGSKEDIIKRLV